MSSRSVVDSPSLGELSPKPATAAASETARHPVCSGASPSCKSRCPSRSRRNVGDGAACVEAASVEAACSIAPKVDASNAEGGAGIVDAGAGRLIGADIVDVGAGWLIGAGIVDAGAGRLNGGSVEAREEGGEGEEYSRRPPPFAAALVVQSVPSLWLRSASCFDADPSVTTPSCAGRGDGDGKTGGLAGGLAGGGGRGESSRARVGTIIGGGGCVCGRRSGSGGGLKPRSSISPNNRR